MEEESLLEEARVGPWLFDLPFSTLLWDAWSRFKPICANWDLQFQGLSYKNVSYYHLNEMLAPIQVHWVDWNVTVLSRLDSWFHHAQQQHRAAADVSWLRAGGKGWKWDELHKGVWREHSMKMEVAHDERFECVIVHTALHWLHWCFSIQKRYQCSLSTKLLALWIHIQKSSLRLSKRETLQMFYVLFLVVSWLNFPL